MHQLLQPKKTVVAQDYVNPINSSFIPFSDISVGRAADEFDQATIKKRWMFETHCELKLNVFVFI